MGKDVAYLGATEGELLELSAGKKAAGLGWQRSWFPHRGRFYLEPDRLVLTEWQEIGREAVRAVDREFTDAYTRFMAGGVRGQFPSFGFIGRWGKPLILRRTEGREALYLLLNYRPMLGVSQNAAWHGRLVDWLRTT